MWGGPASQPGSGSYGSRPLFNSPSYALEGATNVFLPSKVGKNGPQWAESGMATFKFALASFSSLHLRTALLSAILLSFSIQLLHE